jgi:hypothetical protein
MREGLKNKKAVAAIFALWLPMVGYGLHRMADYANTPGRLASPPAQWPSGAPVQLARSRATMIVFAHPQCPCSPATIGELAGIAAHAPGKFEATVFFYLPSTEKADWARTDLWRSATAIPGVRAMVDPDGMVARRFGASTSGQTLLYDSAGRLAFNGGITIARGHSGSNDGRDAIADLLSGAIPRHRTTPVFGCSLLTEE